MVVFAETEILLKIVISTLDFRVPMNYNAVRKTCYFCALLHQLIPVPDLGTLSIARSVFHRFLVLCRFK